MACSNCFNGCVDITPDKCVRYTGEDISELGINNNDPLFSVLNNISSKILTLINGTGIKFTLTESDVCELVQSHLPSCCENITLSDLISALVASICDIQSNYTDLSDIVNDIDRTYVTGCLTGVTSESTTGEIIQATITKICSLNSAFSALVISLNNTYVKKAEIDTYIEAYLESNVPTTLMKDKMIPYVAVEYYGPLTYFDITGAGTGDWDRIFLCNGNNGTPDKRGRIPVGAIVQMGGGALNSAVDPSISGNPNYSLLTVTGANTVTLNTNQIPAHNHTAVAISTADPHRHYLAKNGARTTLTSSNTIDSFSDTNNNAEYELAGTSGVPDLGLSSNETVMVTTNVTINNSGGGQSHSNIPPVLACYYIIYLPA